MIDSNVLLDSLNESAERFSWSALALTSTADVRRVILNPIVYAEISVNFDSIKELDDALPRKAIEREPLPFEASFLAGKAYRGRGGTKLSLLPDFLIGAHAAIAGYQVLTRDAARYRTDFGSGSVSNKRLTSTNNFL